MKVIIFYMILMLIYGSRAYPTGAPDSACISMVPTHNPPENSGDAPFLLTISETSYEPSSSITVTLSKTTTTPFRGFFVQARRSDPGTDQDTPIGSFDVSGEAAAQTRCSIISPDSAVTHVDNSDKDNITVVWTAPSTPEGNLVFKATVVEVFDTGVTSRYWLDVTSSIVTGPAAGTEDTPSVTEEALAPIDVSACGTDKGCYRDPPDCSGGEECEYLLTWKVNGDVVDFEISAKISEQSSWTAVAFSTDTSMGDDSVNDCIYDSTSGTTKVQASWNTDLPTNEVLDNPNLGLVTSNSMGSTVDGLIQCSFSRKIIVANITVQSDADRIFNLTSKYYLFLGRGPATAGILTQHNDLPKISPEMVDVSDGSNYLDIGGSAKNVLVITHGSLMIFAWLVFVSFGILMPRYYKTAWQGEELCGKQVWFQLHRPVMVLGVTLTLIAFVVIFVEVEGYATSLSGVDAAHPILGIIVTALAIINPIMAFFRPHPGTPNRYIFNWAHFTVGTVAQVAAAVTVFLGTRLSKADMSPWAQWLVVGCVAYHYVIEIILASHKYKQMSRQNSVANVKTPDPVDKNIDGIPNLVSSDSLFKNGAGNNPDSSTVFKTALVVTHFVGVLAFAIVLVVDLAS